MNRIFKFFVGFQIGLVLSPLMLVMVLIIVIAAIFGNGVHNELDPKTIPSYIERAKGIHVDWSVLLVYAEEDKSAIKSDGNIIEYANEIRSAMNRNDNDTLKAMAYLLDSDKRGRSVIKDAADFKEFYERFLIDHRFPIHIDEQYYSQDTYGVVKEGLWDKPHNGVDVAAESDIPLFAVAKSKVVKLGNQGSGGTSVTLQNIEYPEFHYYYAHLKQLAPDIRLGAEVGIQDFVGFVGRTGHATGNHLHFMLFVDGEHIDPFWFLTVWEAYDYFYKTHNPTLWEETRDYKSPDAAFSLNQNSPFTGATISMYSRATDPYNAIVDTTYTVYSPSGSSTYSGANVSFSASQPGSYRIVQTVTNKYRKTDTYTLSASVMPPPPPPPPPGSVSSGDIIRGGSSD